MNVNAKQSMCESCGMPMEKKEDFGGGKAGNKYCRYCTDSRGKLKSREDVRRGMVEFYMKSEKKTREAAEKQVDFYMKKLPTWRRKA